MIRPTFRIIKSIRVFFVIFYKCLPYSNDKIDIMVIFMYHIS